MLKISVITATFNAQGTVSETLDSLFGQSYPKIESVVIDGLSTDGTVDIIERYSSRIAFFVSEKDAGIYDALNKGLSKATGDVIGFLHADDTYQDADVLSRIALAFEDPAVEAVYGDLVYVDGNIPSKVLRYWRSSEYKRSLLVKGWMPPHPTLYVRRSIYEKVGNFNSMYRISADYDSILRIFRSILGKAVYIPSVLIRMKAGGISNRSLSTIALKSREDYRIIRSNGLSGPYTLFMKNFRKVTQFLG